MKTEATPSAQWDAMTDEQKIKWLAKFMGYKDAINPDEVEVGDIDTYDFGTRTLWVWKSKSEMRGLQYLDDWNHWREVEEKVMQNDDLFVGFCQEISKGAYNGYSPTSALMHQMCLSLPNRAKALYLALQ